jgi:hypothetical protein
MRVRLGAIDRLQFFRGSGFLRLGGGLLPFQISETTFALLHFVQLLAHSCFLTLIR